MSEEFIFYVEGDNENRRLLPRQVTEKAVETIDEEDKYIVEFIKRADGFISHIERRVISTGSTQINDWFRRERSYSVTIRFCNYKPVGDDKK